MKKLRKLFLLPILALLLSGCNLINNLESIVGGTSQTPPTTGTSEVGTSVSREEINSRVAAAFLNSDPTTKETFRVEIKQDATMDSKEYVNDELTAHEGEHIVQEKSLKAKGLQSAAPQLAVHTEFVGRGYEYGVENRYGEFTLDTYFVDEWIYNNENFRLREGPEGTPFTEESSKTKMYVGPLTSGDILEAAIFGDEGSMLVPAMYFGQPGVLDGITNVSGIETGGILKVTYNISKADYLNLVRTIMLSTIPEELTPEEQEEYVEFINGMVALMDEALEITLYKLTLEITSDNHINKLRSDFNVKMTWVFEPSEWDPEGSTEVMTSAGYEEMTADYNQTFNIEFPDFSDYEERQPPQ